MISNSIGGPVHISTVPKFEVVEPKARASRQFPNDEMLVRISEEDQAIAVDMSA